MREASNASQLRRNFETSPLLLVPEIHWDFCTTEVMVMERMRGIPVSHVDALRAQGIDIPMLARAGVEIFFTQVFRDGFFHADMHPGNIMVDTEGRYIALDFGIMGTLNDVDKHYLAQNFLAFFRRDYNRVAEVHVESGWAPPNTRVDEFESGNPRSVRTDVRQAAEGNLASARCCCVCSKPHAASTSKSSLNWYCCRKRCSTSKAWAATSICGRPPSPSWNAGCREQIGWRGLVRNLKREAPYWAATLPQLPRLLHRIAATEHPEKLERALTALHAQGALRNRLLAALVAVFGLWVAVQVVAVVRLL